MQRSSTFMNYSPDTDRYDEVFDGQGRARPQWERLAKVARNSSRSALSRRANRIRRAVEQDGVTYNIYGNPKGTDRPWEVDLLPFVIGKEEWQFLAAAVAQRARLLNTILADLYGGGHLLAEGMIPPAIIHGHNNYLWPCRGIEPPGGVYLHLYACDLARSPDGRWWVIGDRTQGPSGAGYALQNRLIVTPLYENIFRSLGVPYEPAIWKRDENPIDAPDLGIRKNLAVNTLINLYRVRGHLIADLDPLKVKEPDTHPELDPITHGLTIWE